MRVYTGDNPTQLYLQALQDLIKHGDTYSPRGKEITELRPVCFEFTNPLNRVTFVPGRNINPFFQLAEALWIMSGRSDVKWLLTYNQNMGSFSDDGEDFNAPYGERLRTWNQSRANKFIFNPIDQLLDVVVKIQNDKDTRQAVALIYNPMFDNSDYSTQGGKDVPCNIVLTFKLRGEKLDLTVFNRSNDLHWGVFGANLVQFATIQEVVASWLGVTVGTYRQITDSLHIYTSDYGAKCTDAITARVPEVLGSFNRFEDVAELKFTEEPRVLTNMEHFDRDLCKYWGDIDYPLHSDDIMTNLQSRELVKTTFDSILDPYLNMTVLSMYAYRCVRLNLWIPAIEAVSEMPDSQWKLACADFIQARAINAGYLDVFDRMIVSAMSTSCQQHLLRNRVERLMQES